MDYRGQGWYIPQYDGDGHDDNDVGDLGFDIVFTPGHDQNHHNQRPQQPGHNNQPPLGEEVNEDEPRAPHTELGRRWRIHLVEELEREGIDPGDMLHMPTWHCQIQEDLWRARRRERGQAVWDLVGLERPAGIDEVGDGNDDDDLIFDIDDLEEHGDGRGDPVAEEERRRGVQGAELDNDDAWQRQRRPRRGRPGSDGQGGGEGEAAQRRSLSPTARRELEADLARARDIYQQMQLTAPPALLQEMRAEIEYLEAVLAGRFAQWTRRPENENEDGQQQEGGGGGGGGGDDPDCYYDVPLSAQDPRLPPPGEARTEPVELHDMEGPRYLALVTLDNAAAEAREREREVREEAVRRFGRYEAQWFTVVERALEGRALMMVSGGPRGVIWAVEAGRVDVVGALLRAREEPFNLRSWEVLGVGVGAAEGCVFMLHTKGGGEGEGTE